MKKILTVAIVLIFTGCGGNKVQEDSRDVVYDSLQQIISQKNAELNDIMGTFNDIQEGFREINMAQGRVNLNGIASEKMSKEDIMENISFIQRTMQLNRERIARLQDKDLVIEKQGKEITRLNDNVGQLTAFDASKA